MGIFFTNAAFDNSILMKYSLVYRISYFRYYYEILVMYNMTNNTNSNIHLLKIYYSRWFQYSESVEEFYLFVDCCDRLYVTLLILQIAIYWTLSQFHFPIFRIFVISSRKVDTSCVIVSQWIQSIK